MSVFSDVFKTLKNFSEKVFGNDPSQYVEDEDLLLVSAVSLKDGVSKENLSELMVKRREMDQNALNLSETIDENAVELLPSDSDKSDYNENAKSGLVKGEGREKNPNGNKVSEDKDIRELEK